MITHANVVDNLEYNRLKGSNRLNRSTLNTNVTI